MLARRMMSPVSRNLFARHKSLPDIGIGKKLNRDIHSLIYTTRKKKE